MAGSLPTPDVDVYQIDDRKYVYAPDRRHEIRPIPKIAKANPLDGFRVLVEYENGERGTADLSALIDQAPFIGWRNRDYFESVHPRGSALEWGGGEVDIAPETLYMWCTGASLDEIFPIRFLDVAQD